MFTFCSGAYASCLNTLKNGVRTAKTKKVLCKCKDGKRRKKKKKREPSARDPSVSIRKSLNAAPSLGKNLGLSAQMNL